MTILIKLIALAVLAQSLEHVPENLISTEAAILVVPTSSQWRY